MNKQISLSYLSDELAQVRTKKKEFLERIEQIIPWGEWETIIRPYYYKGERGNKPYALDLMLHLHILQNLYDLSDEAAAAEVIDSRAFSEFCGVESGNQVPDGDTIGRFRNILVKHGLQEKLFAQVVALLTASADEGDQTFALADGKVTLTYSVDESSDPSKAMATTKKCEIEDGEDGIELVIPVQVPGVVSGQTITAIGTAAFINCTGLASVTIPKSVTDIGSEAFRDCTNLEKVTILPDDTYKTKDEVEEAVAQAKTDGLTARIGATAFRRCTALETINIPARVTEIGQNAFEGCAGLTSI